MLSCVSEVNGLLLASIPALRYYLRMIRTACLLALLAHGSIFAAVSLVRVPNGGIQPQAVSDENGAVHLIYYKGEAGGGDIFYVRQQPGASDFSPPIRVNKSQKAIAAGTIRGAQLALGREGRVHVVWNGLAPKGKTYMDAPMLYTRLAADGQSFEPERNVISFAGGLDGGGSVAADRKGNVYVMWHAPKPGNTNGEFGRAVFVARSRDDGKTFARETLATETQTGACGCCGMRAFADSGGNVFALYRGASNQVDRGETLLVSRNAGVSFDIAWVHNWRIDTCPMSSASLAATKSGALAAGETHGRVFFVRVGLDGRTISEPVSPETKGKHPVIAANDRGEILLAWTEGTSWGKGGSIAWQRFDAEGKSLSPIERAEGLPVWSMAAVAPRPDGAFVIIY